MTAAALERLQEKQAGHAATEATPTQSNVKLNAMIVGSRRIGEPFDPLGVAMIEAQIMGPIREQAAPI